MNLYTKAKVDRTVLGYEIPASTFQAVNAIFIILFGTLVAGFGLGVSGTKKSPLLCLKWP